MKTEKDIDNLFKRSLDDPENYPDFRESDWDDMETLLDENKRRGTVYWPRVLSGIAALLLLVSAWYFSGHGGKNTATNITKIPQQTGQKPIDNNNFEPKYKNIATQVKNNTGISGRPSQQRVVLHPNFGHRANSLIRAAAPRHKSFLPLSNDNAGRYTTGKDSTDALTHNSAAIVLRNNANVLAAISGKEFPTDGLTGATAFDGLKPSTDFPKPMKKKLGWSNTPSLLHPQFALTIVASPNINGVNSFSDSKVGLTGGLLFSAGLSKRLTISTGAVYANTPYNANYADYHTTGYKYKTDPLTVNGNCRILDVPLNVDYRLLSRAKYSFSLGSGLSSYFMLRENYHYNYASPNAMGLADVNLANKNKYYLGVLNLDVTYEHKLNSNLGVAVQPYFKVPLTGIGNGQVNLQTTGVAVGLKWNINSLTKD